MRGFAHGETVVRRDVHRSGRVWTEHALRVVADTDEALTTACCPGAEARWPDPYAEACAADERSGRIEMLDRLSAGRWELKDSVWQETVLLQWKPSAEWFSLNAFFVTGPGSASTLRNWYVNFERPIRRTEDGFDTFDLVVDLVIAPDLSRWRWKDEDEYAHARRLGVVSDAEDRAVTAARDRALAMLEGRTDFFADAGTWAAWRWDPAWPPPCLPC